ncbi:MAG: hypothetical protein HW410_1711 [Nitrosarchaeum sp.]|nr:hypothetical protein [Nitrosarchaeum sp.]
MCQEKLLKQWRKSRVSAVLVQIVAEPIIIGYMAKNTLNQKNQD